MAKKTFEQAMEQLEQIVEELESGDLALEKALKKFEDGIRLSRLCSAMLEETETKITRLIKERNGHVSESTLDPDSVEPDTD